MKFIQASLQLYMVFIFLYVPKYVTVLVNGSFSYFKLQWLTKLFHYFLLHYQ